MKKLAYILGALACALILSSCDTRDDWFKDNCEEVYFYFNHSSGVDTIDGHRTKLLEYTIRVEKVGVYIESDVLRFKVFREVFGEKEFIKPKLITEENNIETGDIQKFKITHTSVYQEDDCTIFSGSCSKDVQLFDSDTFARQMGHKFFRLIYEDAFENEYTIRLKLNLIGDIPPIPVLKVTGEGMERKINLSESYDKDGSVSKYEVCIDGNIVEYSKNDNRYEEYGAQWDGIKRMVPDQYWQGGKAAYGGTYITATSINVFNHVFQEPGKHTIYYRCMDNEGAWSTWRKETVEVRE